MSDYFMPPGAVAVTGRRINSPIEKALSAIDNQRKRKQTWLNSDGVYDVKLGGVKFFDRFRWDENKSFNDFLDWFEGEIKSGNFDKELEAHFKKVMAKQKKK